MVVHLEVKNAKNFSIDTWLFGDERVALRASRYFESGKKNDLLSVELTREEFLTFFAHLSVIEMNMKK